MRGPSGGFPAKLILMPEPGSRAPESADERHRRAAREIQRKIEPKAKLNLGTPVTPRPSASITLLRDERDQAGSDMEILMVRRTEAARFMPGFWVFPGGAVDPGDGEPAGGRAHRTCAIRELHEEAGILLAPSTELVPFNRWITPEWAPTRFDAHFFLAMAPPGTRPVPDGDETTAADWFTPSRVLAAHEAGEMALAFPTLRQLEELARYGSAAEALALYRERPPKPVTPVMVEAEDGSKLVLPGDPEYPG